MSATQLSGVGPQVVAQALMSSSTVQLHNLGETVYANDGRVYRYAYAGAVALVAGKLQQAAAQVTGDQNLTAVVSVAGDFIVSSTSTVTWTANQYSNGYCLVSVTPGVGYMYQIASHAAFTAAAPTFTLKDAIQIAWTTSTRLDIIKNPYDSVIVNPATASSAPVGVAVFPVPINNWGWLQVSGVANVLADGAITTGTSIAASNAVAGAVEPAAGVQAIVGQAMSGIADTEYGAIKLSLM